ncbi:allophanate hydrolase [Paenibacillus urinalis]|uniref:allophanate hydrolase n=1 Tax=Paenibacillus urinalis TaxID=521520 RepID=UPI0019617923
MQLNKYGVSNRVIPERLTISGLQQLYKDQALTPREVMETITLRAEEDRDMNIWIVPPSMERIAPYLQRLESMDKEKLPLWGIPFAVKDNIDVDGYPTTAACPDFAYTPSEHAAVVQKLIDAGAVPVGKTNLDQFATGLVGTRSPYGDTHNAYRPELISGGSSSGSPVAVARGQAAFALGTDTAGSGRVPAALNRLVGWKPSLGAWSLRGVVPASASLDCVTVFTHRLQEALLIDEVVRSADEKDHWSRSIPMQSSAAPLKLLIPDQKDLFYGPFEKEYKEAWGQAKNRLAALGIQVESIDTTLFVEAAKLLYDDALVAERWAGLGPFIEEHPGSTFPVTEKVLRSGAGEAYNASSVFQAMHRLQSYKRQAAVLLKDSVLVMPTCGGTWRREDVAEEPITTNRDMGRYTNHCNLLDLCAAAVPADDAAELLPFGITFFALSGQEHLIVHTAAKFESQTEEPIEHLRSPLTIEDSLPDNSGTTQVAVCGLHMRGYPLEVQMQSAGAKFIKEARSAPKYQLVKLNTSPAKPGLIKVNEGGASIQLEVWVMPLEAFGKFTVSIPAPLGIGKIELEDGTEVPGFICEAYAAEGAENITQAGGWRNAVPLPESTLSI